MVWKGAQATTSYIAARDQSDEGNRRLVDKGDARWCKLERSWMVLRRKELLAFLESDEQCKTWDGGSENGMVDRLWAFNQVLSLLYDDE